MCRLEDDSQYLAVAGSLTLHGDDFMTARSFTVMPRVSPKNPVALLIVILAQIMYGNVEFFIDESQGGMVGCRLCGNAVEFNGCTLSKKAISRMNSFRSALTRIVQGCSIMLPVEAMSISEAASDDLLKVETPSTWDYGHSSNYVNIPAI